jgi:hypothetical protein
MTTPGNDRDARGAALSGPDTPGADIASVDEGGQRGNLERLLWVQAFLRKLSKSIELTERIWSEQAGRAFSQQLGQIRGLALHANNDCKRGVVIFGLRLPFDMEQMKYCDAARNSSK